MELITAIALIKKAVKTAGNVDIKHIDLTLVPSSELGLYKEALATAQSAIKEGKITRDEFLRQADLDS